MSSHFPTPALLRRDHAFKRGALRECRVNRVAFQSHASFLRSEQVSFPFFSSRARACPDFKWRYRDENHDRIGTHRKRTRMSHVTTTRSPNLFSSPRISVVPVSLS